MKIAYNPLTEAALTAAPSNNDITFDLKGQSIYAKGVQFKGTDTTYSVFSKGYAGLVPAPSYTTATRFLKEDGTWETPLDNKVLQVNTSTNSEYRILFSNSTSNNDETNFIRKSNNLKFNPNTGTLTTNTFIGNLLGSLAGGDKGSIPYQTATNTTTFLAKGTSGLVLKMDSSGLPYWGTDNNTWRAIQVDSTQIAGTGTETYAVNFKSGTGISVVGTKGSSTAANNIIFNLNSASTTTLGGIIVSKVNTGSVRLPEVDTTTGRYYGIALDTDGKAYVNIPWENTTYNNASTTTAGLMSADDKKKLDGIAVGANNYTYTLPTASLSVLGGIKTNYTTSNKNYAVKVDTNGNAYVNVPWTDSKVLLNLYSNNGFKPILLGKDDNDATTDSVYKSTTIQADAGAGALKLTGNGGLVLQAASTTNNPPMIRFMRGTEDDSNIDWAIAGSSVGTGDGFLIRYKLGSSGWTNVFKSTTTNAYIYKPLEITGVLKSTVSTGTAPLTIASTTKVANLNADMLDGHHASDFFLKTDLLEGFSIEDLTVEATVQVSRYHASGTGAYTSFSYTIDGNGLVDPASNIDALPPQIALKAPIVKVISVTKTGNAGAYTANVGKQFISVSFSGNSVASTGDSFTFKILLSAFNNS